MAGKIKNAVQAKNENAVGKPRTMKGYIKSMESEIAKALPSVITPERFTRMVLTALSTTPELANTTPESFLGAMMTAAQLGVEPNSGLGQAYLIPYRNHGKMECQFQLGYKGLIDLAYRSGEVKTIHAHTVYENDTFQYELGVDPVLRHVPAAANRGNPIFFYAVWNGKDGAYGFEVMSKEDIDIHARKYSQSFGSSYSPWKTSYEEMAKKTVLKKCLKYAPLKSDFVRGMSADATIREFGKETPEDERDFESAKMVTAEYEVSEEELDPYDMADGDLAEGEIPLDAFKDAAGEEPEFMKE